jgi:hypothetical protein
VRYYLDIRCHSYIGLSATPVRALNRQTAQTQVKAGVKPELLRIFHIITMFLAVNRMKAISLKVPPKHPLRPSNSDPATDPKP